MKIEIEKSPYGDEGQVYEGMLGMMNHFRLQLISFRDQPKTKEERARLEADITGYEMIIESGKEENARAFMVHKRDKDHRDLFRNNTDVVNWLKANGKWLEK